MTHPSDQRLALASHMNRALAAGFALLILLMALLAGHAVWHIRVLEARMTDLVEIHNRKIQLATDLIEAAYNRHSMLIYQTLADDPFERDDNFQSYIKWGYHVGKARNDLKALPLDKFETDNLSQQDRLVEQIIVLQEEISDLAARELRNQALALISGDLRPLNVSFTETIEALRLHERDQIRGALVTTQAATRNAVQVHLLLGGLLLLLAVLITMTTLRLMSRRAHIIDEQVHALEEVSERLEHEATHDPLTGLANRALFYQRLAQALEHAEQENFQVGVLYLDLDHFKPVNDEFGHAAGDLLLKEVAARLKHQVRVSDTVARLGGDEFALIMLGTNNEEVRQRMREQLAAEIARPVDLGPAQVTPGCSIGCAVYPLDGRKQDELINVADMRMYENKQSRREDETGASCPPA